MERCPKTEIEKCGYVNRVVTPNFCSVICKQKAKEQKKADIEIYHPFPSLTEMIKNVAVEATKHLTVDRRIRTQQEIEKIMSVCKECEFYTETAGAPRCTKCGCFLSIKRRWVSSSCPIKKW